MSGPRWLLPLAWPAYLLAVVLMTLVAVGGLVVGENGVALAATGVGAVLLFVGRRYIGRRGVPGDSEGSAAPAHNWGDVSRTSAFEPRERAPGERAVYETRVDDQPVTARLVGAAGPETTDAGVTLVETPTGVARPGTGFTVESSRDEIPLSAATSRRVRSLLRSTGGRLRFDDRVGVVRHESGGTLADPETLERAAKTVAAVAHAVEDSAAIDTAHDTVAESNAEGTLSLEEPERG